MRRSKTTETKRSNRATVARNRRLSASDQVTEVARLTRELKEAREQQVATADVLKVISRSPTDAQPAFDMIAERAAQLCDGQFCFVYRFDGQLLHFVAHYSLTPEVLEMNRRAYPAPPSRRSAAARAILERGFVQIPDISADPDYVLGAMAVVGDYRSVVGVPILRDGIAIGSIAVARAQAGPLPDPQIELLKTFADQAAIAIENVRLFEAEQQRTHELSQSLEQQTATADVLRVISSSPGDLEPVFGAMLENAIRICEANFGNMFLIENGMFRTVAMHNAPAAYANARTAGGPFRPPADSGPGRLVSSKDVVHIADLKAEETYLRRDPFSVAGAELAGIRTLLAVPMLKDDALIGAIVIYRQEVRPFTDKQIDLVRNFAAQAVIAIENTRLLNELRQRTDDLTESLEQQTATSQVLQVISKSSGDLVPVFDSILINAKSICEAKFAHLLLYDGEVFHAAAMEGTSDAFVEFWRRGPHALDPRTGPRRAVATKQVIHIPDIQQTERYQKRDPQLAGLADLARARAVLVVPMLKDDHVIGTLNIYREVPVPFSHKQIDLVSNFARQAVIAIENTRLLSELRESLEQQTATSEVLQVISSSPGELEPVFNAILENAARICQAQFGALNTYDGSAFRNAALFNPPPQFALRLGEIIHPHSESGLGYVARTKQIAHIDDIRTRQPYLERDKAVVGLADLAGARTLLIVPMYNPCS